MCTSLANPLKKQQIGHQKNQEYNDADPLCGRELQWESCGQIVSEKIDQEAGACIQHAAQEEYFTLEFFPVVYADQKKCKNQKTDDC